MTIREKGLGACIVIALAIAPLIRFSIEDTSITRHTWSWLVLIFTLCIVSLCLNYKRVHALFSPIILAITSLPFISAAIGLLPIHHVALLYAGSLLLTTASIFLCIQNKKLSSYILYTLLCATSLYAQWGIAQYIAQKDLGLSFIGESIITTSTNGVATYYDGAEKFIRSYGPFGHPNSLAGILIVGCIVCAYLYSRNRDTLFTLSILGTLLLGILTTFSRSALLAAIFVCAIGLFTRFSRTRILAIPIIIIIFSFASLMLVRTNDVHDVAAHDRLEGLQWALAMTTPTSFLRGVGIGNYEQALSNYLVSHNIPHHEWDIAPVHSIPIQLFMETGIILTLFILGVCILFITKHKLWIFFALLPALLVDHYFITQFGPLILLIASTLLSTRAILQST